LPCRSILWMGWAPDFFEAENDELEQTGIRFSCRSPGTFPRPISSLATSGRNGCTRTGVGGSVRAQHWPRSSRVRLSADEKGSPVSGRAQGSQTEASEEPDRRCVRRLCTPWPEPASVDDGNRGRFVGQTAHADRRRPGAVGLLFAGGRLDVGGGLRGGSVWDRFSASGRVSRRLSVSPGVSRRRVSGYTGANRRGAAGRSRNALVGKGSGGQGTGMRIPSSRSSGCASIPSPDGRCRVHGQSGNPRELSSETKPGRRDVCPGVDLSIQRFVGLGGFYKRRTFVGKSFNRWA
jgi:hypothetical protein